MKIYKKKHFFVTENGNLYIPIKLAVNGLGGKRKSSILAEKRNIHLTNNW